MASIFGYEVQTPDEILAQRGAEYEALKARDPSNPQIAMSQAIFNLVGSPELSKARATQKALTGAMETFKAPEGADEFTKQIAQAEHIRNSMASVDPQLALQANDKVLALRNEQLQQSKLKADLEYGDLRGKTAKLALEEAQQTAKDAKEKILFKINATTGAVVPVKSLGPEITSDEAIAELQAAQQGASGGDSYTLGTGLDLWQVSDVFKPSYARAGGGPNDLTSPEYRAARKSLDDGRQALNSLGRVSEALGNDILAANQMTGQIAGSGLNVLDAYKRLAAEFGSGLKDEDRAASEYQLNSSIGSRQQQIEEAVQRLGANSSVVQAQIKGVAYQLAKTLDPGGRLSDQDVAMAMEMVIGNGDPSVILSLFRERKKALSDSVLSSRFAAQRGVLGDQGSYLLQEYDAANEDLESKLIQMQSQIRARRLETKQVQQPGATPAGGAPAAAPTGKKIEFTIKPKG